MSGKYPITAQTQGRLNVYTRLVNQLDKDTLAKINPQILASVYLEALAQDLTKDVESYGYWASGKLSAAASFTAMPTKALARGYTSIAPEVGFKQGEHFYFYNLQFLTELQNMQVNPDILFTVSGQLNESGCIFKHTKLLTLAAYKEWLDQVMVLIRRLPMSAPKTFEQQLVILRSRARQLTSLGKEKPQPPSQLQPGQPDSSRPLGRVSDYRMF